MVFGKNKILTLNIESTHVRFLVATGKRVEKWGSIPLEPGMVKEGLILDKPAVSKAVRQLASQAGTTGKKVVASFSGFQSLQRFPELPKISSQLMD